MTNSESVREFAADRAAPKSVRAWCRAQLLSVLGDSANPLVDDVELVASELVTNAVQAGTGSTRIGLLVRPAGVTVRVTDDVNAPLVARTVDGTSESGRGLAIVATLARRWGVDPHPPGKTVWAELAVN